MKIKFLTVIMALFILSSCSYRLVDFTVISTKNAEIGVDRSQGVPTEGSKAYFLGLGWNLKDALDDALENAGTKYDLLIDGVVNYQTFPFVSVVKVKGLAISSADLRAQMGEEEFEQWKLNNNIFNPEVATVEE